MNALIRSARIDDAAAISDLMPHLGYAATPAQIASRLGPMIASPLHTAFVAELDGAVVGLCALASVQHLASDGYAEVLELVVHEGCQHRGLGRQLMACAQDWALQRGHARVRLRSGVQRTEAHRFYERLGYAKSRASFAFERTFELPDRAASGAEAVAADAPGPRAADAVGGAGRSDRATSPVASVMVRKAMQKDAAAIQGLYGQLVSNPALCVQAESLAALEVDERTALLVAETDGAVVGTVLVALCADVMFRARPFAVVENIVVDAAARGRGVGAALLQAVERHCAEADCSKIMLLSAAGRSEAHHFFEKMGFAGSTKRGFVKYSRQFGGAA